MKTRPILMSAPMVQALLDGRKTQTRRIIKPQPLHIEWFEHQKEWCAKIEEMEYKLQPCPYGKLGDLLWVRETFLPRAKNTQALYKADYDDIEAAGISGMYSDKGWKPSIFMPRWASRLTLEISEVRVQRLQDISDADIVAEGINGKLIGGKGKKNIVEIDLECGLNRARYSNLWEEINGAGSWESNPWVWPITFNIHKWNVDNWGRNEKISL